MLWILFLLFFVGCVNGGECPKEDLSLAPRPYTKPGNLSICKKPYLGPNCTCPPSMFECACHKFGRCGDKPGCIPASDLNNFANDCGDGSDELSNVCCEGRFQCDCFNTTCKGIYGCLPDYDECDGTIHCLDGSDEFNCICPTHMFECNCFKTKTCRFGNGCIDKRRQCDGYNSCGDWGDEVDCNCPAGYFECDCYKRKNCKTGWGCIRKRWLCDGSDDCKDGGDEVNCTCPAHKFECDCHKTKNCSTRDGCISKNRRCNGRIDCLDGSDEINCTCPTDMFECRCYRTKNCRYSGGCLKKVKQCNGLDDCGDWSDEVNCTYPADKFECNCYKTKNCLKPSLRIIDNDSLCDGYNDCGDWSDEIACSCSSDQFECNCYKTRNCTYRYGCIDKLYQCDGEGDCDDDFDEVNCTCPAHKFKCACLDEFQCELTSMGACIDRSLLCNGNRDCIDGSDETHHTCNCSGDYARCPHDPIMKDYLSADRCIPLDWLGDGLKDCSDGSDELCLFSKFTLQSCTMFATTCESEHIARYLIHSTVPAKCNTVIQQTCADDINNCKIQNVICISSDCNITDNFSQSIFICENQAVIAGSNFCDLAGSCSDNSDEITSGFGFKCSGSSRHGVCVLPQINLYDSMAQCSDKSDLCFANGQFRCFQCLDKKLIISLNQVCDGIVDCFDMSDECLCLNQNLCNDVRGGCPSNQMLCESKSFCSNQSGKLCNSSVQCIDQVNMKYCSPSNYLAHTRCLPENFENIGDDDFLKCSRNYNHLLKKKFRDHISLFPYRDPQIFLNSICDGTVNDDLELMGELNCSNMFYCFTNGKINIKNEQVCDGKVDCDDSSDEFPELCHNHRFYCKSKGKISIYRKSVCDGIIDCDNAIDESKCRCEKKRFYCTSKSPLSVELKFVQNGIRDCLDGSDECVNLAENSFADVNEMIANPIYRAIFWTTALLALSGNLFVFIATLKSLWNVESNQNVFINTSIFILNLCCSDFLMGIYLLAIIIQGTRFSGSYCLFDKEWRSSSLCSGLGALAIVASEASAFTMTAMTSFRLLSVFKPFVTRNLSILSILLAEVFCWILAVLLATIPLLNTTSEYFTADVWFPNNFFGNDFVPRENMSRLAERIAGVKPTSWVDVKLTIKKTFPRNGIEGEFGYYGETSVCMPRLFATATEFAYEYSTFLITINFVMFIYMLIAYLLIYKQSNHMKGSRSNDVSSKMQKRISRLILTDFCCWIPVCVMGYLSVGGIKMPPDVYVLSACLLLPINSALNPLLYSKAIEAQLFRAKIWIGNKTPSFHTATNRITDLGVRQNASTNQGDRVIETVQ